MQTLTAAELMTRAVVTVHPDTPLLEAVELLVRLGISGMPVVDQGGKVVGVITEYDCIHFAMSGDARETRVSEAMSRDVISVGPDTPCPAIANLFAAHRIRRAPVLEDGKLVGIVSRRDVLRQMLYNYMGRKA